MDTDSAVKVSILEKVTVTMPSEMLAAVDNVCVERDQKRSAFVRRAIRRALAEEQAAAGG